MPLVKVKNLKNEEIGEIYLSDSIFGVLLNKALVYEAVKEYRANGRRGTSATKTRGEVSGSGRKLWKQKGTGRARISSIRSPLWKGGGNVHGPQPRNWGYKLPKKMRYGAIRSVLSERLREGGLMVVDDFSINSYKTRDFISVLGLLGVKKKVLLVDPLGNKNLILASRNIPGVKCVNGYGVNVYDVLDCEQIIISKSAIVEIEQVLS